MVCTEGVFGLTLSGKTLTASTSPPVPYSCIIDKERQPTIYAAKKAIMQAYGYGRLRFYVDFHGHVNKYNTFLYGNALKGDAQVCNLLFAKLLSINSLHFDYSLCNFSEFNMKIKDRISNDGREGCGRVAVYNATKLPNCYSIEASFYGSKRINTLPPKLIKDKSAIERESVLTNPFSRLYAGRNGAYTPEVYGDIGRVSFSNT